MSDTNSLRARIASELNRALSDSFGNSGESFATVVNREINDAIKHYESTRFRWNERNRLEFATTTADVRAVSLPPLFIQMDGLQVKYSSSRLNLRRISKAELDEMDTAASTQPGNGIPSKYAVYGNQIQLFPVPNGAYTLIGSFIQRYLPTSITDSTTAVITMGGISITVTTTTSHKNRANGWTQEGETLIRARAVASIEIYYLKREAAIAEAQRLEAMRLPYLSVRERQAHERLTDEAFDAQATGRIRPYRL